MPPRPKHTDENGTTKDKLSASTGAGVTKSKKTVGGSNLKDVTNASSSNADTGANGASGNQALQSNATLDFENLPRHVLHAYRAAYNLPLPSSFKSFHNGVILSVPGSVGLQSPTMLRPKEKRRIPKRQLAKACRNHFCDQSVNELDVESRMMYNVKQGDKAFRMKFPPQAATKKQA